MERSPILNLWHRVFGYQIILKPSSVAVGMMQNHAIVVYSHLVITPYLAFWHSHLQVHPLVFPYLDVVTLLQPACFWWNDHLFWAKSLGVSAPFFSHGHFHPHFYSSPSLHLLCCAAVIVSCCTLPHIPETWLARRKVRNFCVAFEACL